MPRSDRIAQARAHRHTRGGLIALAAFLSVAALGCSGDDGATPSTSTTAATGSSTTTEATAPTTTSESTTNTTAATSGSTPPAQSAEQEIVARYIGYWNARLAANSGTPDPEAPALRDFATGAQLDAVIAETRTNLEQGLALRPADDPADFQQVEVIEVDGDRAVVQECVVDDQVVIRRDSGEVVNDAVATHNVRGELQKIDGVWRVSEARLVQRWEGVAGCASAP